MTTKSVQEASRVKGHRTKEEGCTVCGGNFFEPPGRVEKCVQLFVTTCQKQSNIEEFHSQLFFPLSFSQHPLIMHVIESFRG